MLGDLGVRPAARHECEHLSLTGRELLELGWELRRARQAGRTEGVAAKQAAMVTRRRAVLAELPPLFRAADLPALKERLIVLRYLDRYLEECNAALDDE